MNKTVLHGVKTYIGIPEEDTDFDQMLLMHIRAAISDLSQMTPIDATSFIWLDETVEWEQIFGTIPELGLVTEFVCIRTSILFDPTVSSAVLAAKEKRLSTTAWRINLTCGSRT